jgi:hypothetical protein
MSALVFRLCDGGYATCDLATTTLRPRLEHHDGRAVRRECSHGTRLRELPYQQWPREINIFKCVVDG